MSGPGAASGGATERVPLTSPPWRAFGADLPFPPDPFQVEAFDSLDLGHSVLVSAPTGSGKTLVASYAIHRTVLGGGRAFYTTPLKALSNQKYAELTATYGEGRVGLLTGDVGLHPEAPVVVMTTEVLRNMLLADSGQLGNLRTVVLDEVHYLQDPYRGGVWEEVLVLSPTRVQFVCLSATVANADELGRWLRSVRGATDVIVERTRPVTLRHHFALHHRGSGETSLVPLLDNGRVSPDGQRFDQAARRSLQGRPPPWQRGRPPAARLPFRAPRRTELVETLEERHLLPAIVFIFSRSACDEAVRQCLRDGVRLSERSERSAIRRIAEAHVERLSDADLSVLGFGEWCEGLESGVAAHHAGLVPAFREAVEACFSAGLLRVVFATETLSLGINMPARTVVIERFTKFGGAGRAPLTSGEYAQLTGRAGRRGLDAEGHAVVSWSNETTLREVARVASAPPPDLRSAFRPTYNLTVNLVRRFERATALEVLRRSFAQWQAAHRGAAGRDALADIFGRRLAVLEELGYVEGWRLTPAGERLSRIYHESDLLVAEAIASGVLDGAEGSVLCGVLSCFVFERRRARWPVAHGTTPGAGGGRGGRRGPPGAGAERRRRRPEDRVGERRRGEVAERIAQLEGRAERVRGAEEVHTLPRTRTPEPGLAGAVTAWARGASFASVIELAAIEVGEIAPGDFVRTIKQLADLVEQVSLVSPVPATVQTARDAVGRLLRDVVAAGATPSVGSFSAASATDDGGEF